VAGAPRPRPSLLRRRQQPGSSERAGWAGPAQSSGHRRLLDPLQLGQAVPPSVLTTHLVQSTSVEQLLDVCVTFRAQLNHIHISAALVRLAKLAMQQQQQAAQAQAQQRQHPRRQPPQAPAPVPSYHVSWLLDELVTRLGCCSARELVNVLWALARLADPRAPRLPQLPALLASLTDLLAADSSPSCVQHASNALWALATLQLQPGEGLTRVLLEAMERQPLYHTATSQQVANAMWAAARLQLQVPPGWISSLLGHLLRPGEPLAPQAAANCLWACAVLQPPAAAAADGTPQLGHPHSEGSGAAVPLPGSQLQQVLAAAQQLLHTAGPQELANLVWACGKLRHTPQPPFLDAYWVASQQQLAAASPQELANTLFGMARCCRAAPAPDAWRRSFLAASQQLLPSFSCQELANMVWAAAWLRWRPPAAWMDGCLDALLPQLQTATAGHISMAVWGLGRLGYRPPGPAMEALLAAMEAQLPSAT